ncbi:hypothetical protein [Desulfoluna limicola]|uniref:hypothetical protein n=1 Tax=Desulfoluna limicola TaxID=2810562 RepID=UPI001F16C09B|nr:hypothetical protein [Desulfoluna limicola]
MEAEMYCNKLRWEMIPWTPGCACIRPSFLAANAGGGALNYWLTGVLATSMGRRKKKHTKSDASGGKVSHLESKLPQRFNPRSSGQITASFYEDCTFIFCVSP